MSLFDPEAYNSFLDDARCSFETHGVDLVAFAGKKRSGKDTAGSIFSKEFGFEEAKLSSGIKNVVQEVFNFPEALTRGHLKNDPHPSFPLSYRKAMQVVGTDLFQEHFSKHIWTWSLLERLQDRVIQSSQRRFVITDARFSFQCESLERVGGTVFYVKRGPLVPRWRRSLATLPIVRRLFSLPPHLHPSEIELDGTRYAQERRYRLLNDGTLPEFKDAVRDLATAHGF